MNAFNGLATSLMWLGLNGIRRAVVEKREEEKGRRYLIAKSCNLANVANAELPWWLAGYNPASRR